MEPKDTGVNCTVTVSGMQKRNKDKVQQCPEALATVRSEAEKISREEIRRAAKV